MCMYVRPMMTLHVFWTMHVRTFRRVWSIVMDGGKIKESFEVEIMRFPSIYMISGTKMFLMMQKMEESGIN